MAEPALAVDWVDDPKPTTKEAENTWTFVFELPARAAEDRLLDFFEDHLATLPSEKREELITNALTVEVRGKDPEK